MKRFGMLMIFIIAGFVVLSGCGEDEEEFNTPYAVEIGDGEGNMVIKTSNCLPIGLNIFIDSVFVGMISTGEPALVHSSPGSHQLYARSIGGILDSIEYFWWEEQVSAATDYAPVIRLDCEDAERIFVPED